MKTFIALTISALVALPAAAQDAPTFFSDTYPAYALDEMMAAHGALNGDESALDPKTRELVALGVSAQIPCSYCVYAHTKQAKAAGATDEEIRAAVASAALVRHWSTVLNGMAYDMDAFKTEVDKLVPTN